MLEGNIVPFQATQFGRTQTRKSAQRPITQRIGACRLKQPREFLRAQDTGLGVRLFGLCGVIEGVLNDPAAVFGKIVKRLAFGSVTVARHWTDTQASQPVVGLRSRDSGNDALA